MKNIKDELQNIILGDEQVGRSGNLKKAQSFLRRYAKTSISIEKQQHFKNQETAALIAFAQKEQLFYNNEIPFSDFLSEGAEQKVYRLNDTLVLKINKSIFYETWLDYFNSIILHNFFFPATAYTFIGFQIIEEELYAVVSQEFIFANENTNLLTVRDFLNYNGFKHVRNNDYLNQEIGLILEDLHDENVLSYNGILYFVDTVFYITKDFFKN